MHIGILPLPGIGNADGRIAKIGKILPKRLKERLVCLGRLLPYDTDTVARGQIASVAKHHFDRLGNVHAGIAGASHLAAAAAFVASHHRIIPCVLGILTKGNEAEQNSVFKPVSGYSSQTDAPTAADPTAEKKHFPKTTADPVTLDINLSNYGDTIFLSETISPWTLYEEVQVRRDTLPDSSGVYLNYLRRAGKKFKNHPDYYLNILRYNAVEPGTNPALDLSNNPIPGFDYQSDGKGVTTLTLPYYYLENPARALLKMNLPPMRTSL
jgi:hypothetical protein